MIRSMQSGPKYDYKISYEIIQDFVYKKTADSFISGFYQVVKTSIKEIILILMQFDILLSSQTKVIQHIKK